MEAPSLEFFKRRLVSNVTSNFLHPRAECFCYVYQYGGDVWQEWGRGVRCVVGGSGLGKRIEVQGVRALAGSEAPLPSCSSSGGARAGAPLPRHSSSSRARSGGEVPVPRSLEGT